MLQLLRVSISKHAALKTTLGKGLPAVSGNAAQIRQIVMNLITNASEAIGERDGVILVLTERATGSNVPGVESLPEGALSAAPGVGYRKRDGARKPKQTFRSILYDQVRRPGNGTRGGTGNRHGHGGTVHVVSSLGEGTSVEILLPCAGEMVPDRMTVPVRRDPPCAKHHSDGVYHPDGGR